jgi:hypothetical protein
MTAPLVALLSELRRPVSASSESPSALSGDRAAMSHRMGLGAALRAGQVSGQPLIYLANSCARYWRNLNNGSR